MIFSNYRSPVNGQILAVNGNVLSDGVNKFEVKDEISEIIYPFNLHLEDQEAHDFYEGRADDYDKYLHLTFQTYNEDEIKVREQMIQLLDLKPYYKVLEIASGTGRDSVLIYSKLSKDGELHVTDISLDMLSKAKEKIGNKDNVYYTKCNALHLPFEDDYFDAVYSFGALGEFSDKSKFFNEVIRVSKKGSKVVVGDENLPVWQRKTLFGKILANYNKQFLAEVPFESLPIEARNVVCRWIIGGVFYLFDFEVGEGEPFANFDFQIPGVRGGTHLTRYYGQLEGVDPEVKKIAWEAVQIEGISMHDWLNELVRKEALKVINK